jgi:hypothetical protein
MEESQSMELERSIPGSEAEESMFSWSFPRLSSVGSLSLALIATRAAATEKTNMPQVNHHKIL